MSQETYENLTEESRGESPAAPYDATEANKHKVDWHNEQK